MFNRHICRFGANHSSAYF
uniref:Uncharacterized protein n=1 Tax=Anguilla anguilla TaxID=7936 RepID=A0A0E9UA30_ANGAN